MNNWLVTEILLRYYCHPTIAGKEQISNRNILPEATKQFFTTRLFCCYEYKNIGKAVEETMFQLVQRGVTLTPAEKMRALSTRWATLWKQYEDQYSKVISRKYLCNGPDILIYPLMVFKYRNRIELLGFGLLSPYFPKYLRCCTRAATNVQIERELAWNPFYSLVHKLCLSFFGMIVAWMMMSRSKWKTSLTNTTTSSNYHRTLLR